MSNDGFQVQVVLKIEENIYQVGVKLNSKEEYRQPPYIFKFVVLPIKMPYLTYSTLSSASFKL